MCAPIKSYDTTNKAHFTQIHSLFQHSSMFRHIGHLS